MKTLSIEFTNYCNNKCTFCPNGSDPREKGFISPSTLQGILEKTQKYKLLEIQPVGLGCTFLHPFWFEMIQYIRKFRPGVTIRMVTNGIALNEQTRKKLSQLLGKNDSLLVSLNASNKCDYKKMMGTSHYHLVENNLISLLQEPHEYTTKVQFIITRTNWWKLPGFVLYWKCHGVNKIFFRLMENWGGLIQDVSTFLKVEDSCDIPNHALVFTWTGEQRPCCVKLAEGARCEECLEMGTNPTIRKIRKLKAGLFRQ
jgi:MoaA/NifB/PqqE/SkfB family radical SAM enzyme